MSALSPLPNAAAFAIPDFVASLRGGKLIRRGISHLPQFRPMGNPDERRERWVFDGITEFSELTELGLEGQLPA
jgi:hypothetical protein